MAIGTFVTGVVFSGDWSSPLKKAELLFVSSNGSVVLRILGVLNWRDGVVMSPVG